MHAKTTSFTNVQATEEHVKCPKPDFKYFSIHCFCNFNNDLLIQDMMPTFRYTKIYILNKQNSHLTGIVLQPVHPKL